MLNGERTIKRAIRWGMVGGGRGSQIGYIHRCAALRDRYFNLVAGAFDINYERSKDFGQHIDLDPSRCYLDYATMFAEEAKRSDGIEAVSVTTPNSTHYEITKAALEAGLHVICEKPLCFTIQEAEELVLLAEKNNLIVGVTYGYSGHQLIEQAREMVKRGDLGEIRIINMQFAHGGNNIAVEEHSPAAKWRMEPSVAGPSYILGDVGTHALFMGETIVPHLQIERLLCTKQSFVKSRQLEDNANVLITYTNGAIGHLWASGVNCGSIHGLVIRVIGEKASIEWWDERPNQLKYEIQGQAPQIIERGESYLYPSALNEDRISAGHPEGLFESWANLYRRFAIAIDATQRRDHTLLNHHWYPNVRHGADGVKFINKCIQSAEAGSVWIEY